MIAATLPAARLLAVRPLTIRPLTVRPLAVRPLAVRLPVPARRLLTVRPPDVPIRASVMCVSPVPVRGPDIVRIPVRLADRAKVRAGSLRPLVEQPEVAQLARLALLPKGTSPGCAVIPTVHRILHSKLATKADVANALLIPLPRPPRMYGLPSMP